MLKTKLGMIRVWFSIHSRVTFQSWNLIEPVHLGENAYILALYSPPHIPDNSVHQMLLSPVDGAPYEDATHWDM